MQQSFAGQLFGFERAQLPVGSTLRLMADARFQISNYQACCPRSSAGSIRPGSNGSFVTFIRRENGTGETFGVDGATDMAFNPTSPTAALPPVDPGDGTECGNVWGNTSISAASAFYFRVLVTVP